MLGAAAKPRDRATVGPPVEPFGAARAPARSALGSAALALALLLGASSASAQPWARDAAALAREGRRAEAIERLERAERDEVGGRDELASLYATRAELRDALGDHEGARIDLRRLAAIDARRELPSSAPLALRRALGEERAALGGPLDIDVEVRRAADHAVVRTSVRRAAGLALTVRVSARAGDARWQVQRGPEVTFPALALDTLELVIELIGPRGIVLAARGTPASPERFPGAAGASGEVAAENDTGDAVGWGIGISVGVLVVVAATLGIVSTVGAQGADHTALEGPTVRF